MLYNWQQDNWPHFTYDLSDLEDSLLEFIRRTGRIGGLMEGLSPDSQSEFSIDFMVKEALKTSEIEGEYLSRTDVISSVKKNLGFNISERPKDQKSIGAASLMTSVREHYLRPLSKKALFEWHKLIMMGSQGIKAGNWRSGNESMQVISGAIGREKVHFEAPPSDQVPVEMRQFIDWFNQCGPGGKNEIKHAPVRSAIAHLYFETIHPFEDGNGRIGRAIADKALSQGIGQPILLSLSQSIETKRNDYYEALKKAQRSNEITPWINYFVNLINSSQQDTERQVAFTLKKTRFFDEFTSRLNDRQLSVVKRMLEEGPTGFEGGMSAKKYMGIAKTTKTTATRDLKNLVQKGVLEVSGGGRSTRYEVRLG